MAITITHTFNKKEPDFTFYGSSAQRGGGSPVDNNNDDLAYGSSGEEGSGEAVEQEN